MTTSELNPIKVSEDKPSRYKTHTQILEPSVYYNWLTRVWIFDGKKVAEKLDTMNEWKRAQTHLSAID